MEGNRRKKKEKKKGICLMNTMKYLNRFTNSCLLLLATIIVTGSLSACKDDDDTQLTMVTNLSYEPTMGGAIISFTPPANNDLLYVKAAYVNSTGKSVFRSTSIYSKTIEIDGLADENKTYPVRVSAVDKWGGETEAAVIYVQPGRSYINIIKDNLEIHPMCGGLSVVWENPAGVETVSESADNPGKTVYVVVDYTDANGTTFTRYLSSKMKQAKTRVRGLFAGLYNVSFHVEDVAGNRTEQSTATLFDVPAETEFTKFVEREDPINGLVKDYVWKLVPSLTTLQEAWEFKNSAIFDGVINIIGDANTRSYCGTDCDASTVTYGGTIPWDTEQVDIVIDLNQIVSIARLKAWQRAYHYGEQPYAGGDQMNDGVSKDYDFYQPTNLKHFKVFGSATLDESGWFLIQDCDIATNTTNFQGTLPQYWSNPEWYGNTNVYMPTNESYAVAIEGHEWELNEMTEPVRYIRVRLVENWDLAKRTVSGLSELSLYGSVIVSSSELAEQETAREESVETPEARR